MSSLKTALFASATAIILSACSATAPQPFDYSAFRESKPRSILVLPPLNESPEVKASAGMLASSTQPLAESGYYVFPVAAVAETFKQNGLDNAHDIHQVSPEKLNRIFGADAVLYIKINQYGTSYQLIQSDTRVTAEAKLVDAKTGKELWHGSATASSTENNNTAGQGLLGAMLSAIVQQIASSVGDKGFDIAQVAGTRLLSASATNGIMYGPYSPHYEAQPGK